MKKMFKVLAVVASLGLLGSAFAQNYALAASVPVTPQGNQNYALAA